MPPRGTREPVIETYSSTTRVVHTRGLLVTESPVVSCMPRNLPRHRQKASRHLSSLARKETRGYIRYFSSYVLLIDSVSLRLRRKIAICMHELMCLAPRLITPHCHKYLPGEEIPNCLRENAYPLFSMK